MINKNKLFKTLIMGDVIVYRNRGNFTGNTIQKEQLRRRFPIEHARYTHCEISGGKQWAVSVHPPKTKTIDIFKQHSGRYIKILRYKNPS